MSKFLLTGTGEEIPGDADYSTFLLSPLQAFNVITDKFVHFEKKTLIERNNPNYVFDLIPMCA